MSSANITIKEGGTARAFGPVSRLRVLKQDTGSEDFVPESATSETTKSITENGTYFAAQDNAYGYSQVSVNCNQEADSLTGKGQDGNEYNVRKDSSGNVEEEKLPSEIRITTMPTYTGPYVDGAYIDFAGIVVHAYDAMGDDMGEVPFDELVFPVTTASYDQAADTGEYDVTGLGLNAPVYLQSVKQGDVMSLWTNPKTVVTGVTGHVLAFMVPQSGINYGLVFVCMFPGCAVDIARENGSFAETIYLNLSGEIDGETYYYCTPRSANTSIGWEWAVSASQETDIATAAGMALLGGHPKGSIEDLPVNWLRPCDGLLLETTFEISVVDVLAPMTDDGGVGGLPHL